MPIDQHHVSHRPRITKQTIRDAAKRLSNWGKWGDDDQIGTLNYITAEDVVAATQLVRKGKVFAMGIDFNAKGPQNGGLGRFNPVLTMLRDGCDGYAGLNDAHGIRGSDDMIVMPLQCATHWDGLGHIFFEDKMWNGYDIRSVSSFGASKAGIENTRDKFIGRGILLDIARYMKVERLPDGFAITSDMLEECAKAQGTVVKRGDFLLFRTGQLEEKLATGKWGDFAGGDAPGLAFETLDWLHKKEIAALASDTWGVEVRPNETTAARQPWHWICIPIMGLTMGEMFNMGPLALDCSNDKSYEFLFVAPSLPITGAVSSPINPMAIR